MRPIQTKHGFWVIEGDNFISKWANESGRLDHDQYLVPNLCKWIKSGDYVIDGGAYIGDHTIAYQRAVGSSGKVVALEPNRVAYSCLVKNVPEAIHMNKYLNDRENEVSFLDLDNVNCGATKLASRDSESDSMASYMVDAVTIDSIVTGALKGKCDFIKLDLEGHEVNALTGAAWTLMKLRPVVALEINRGALQRNGYDFETVIACMEALEYKFIQFPEGQMTDPQYDLVFIPMEDYVKA